MSNLWRGVVVAALVMSLGCSADAEKTPAPASDQGEDQAGPAADMKDAAEMSDLGTVDFGYYPELPNVPGGNPLVPEVGMYPFPSNFYLEPDEATKTGWRFAPSAEALPNRHTAQMFEGIDGFSRIPLILTHLPGGIDAATLPDPAQADATLKDDAPVFLLEGPDWVRVPALVEVDMNAASDADRALIIRPHRTLKANAEHVVVVTNRLKRVDGQPHAPNQAFVSLRDGIKTTSAALERQRDGFEQVRLAWRAQGLEDGQIVQGWAFHTRSEEAVVNPLLHMQRVASTHTLGAHKITKDELDEQNRQIVGTFEAPNFVNPDGYVELDAQGVPKQFGTREVEFVLTVPLNVEEPRPLIIFGHGFFYEKIEATRSSFNSLCVQGRFSAAAVDFEGFDEASAGSSIVLLTDKIPEVDKLISKQLQAYTHFTVLTRLVKERLADELVREDGQGGSVKVIDPAQVHYMGISNGATFGAVIAATSPEFERAVLVVGGGGLVHFLERAQSWNTMGRLFKRRWSKALELQLVMSLLQHKFDPIDSLNYASHLVQDRFDGLKPLKLSLHMAVNDSLVNNILTEMVARTAGVPMILPSPRQAWGVQTIEAPAPEGAPASTTSALFVYDEQLTPSPLNNVAPLEDNDAHERVRRLDVYKAQVIEFIDQGRFVQVCDGACDPN